MIRPAGIANGQGRHAEILEWLHPGLKHRRDGLVTLQVDTSNRAGAIIDIKVTCEFRVIGFQVHVGSIGEMLCDVGARAENALLLAGPQRETHGTPQPKMRCLQNAHGFEHDGRAGCIVRRARSGVPRIEMRAEHDKLVSLVGSGNLANDVERIQIVIVKLVFDIHLDANGNFLFQHSPDAPVVLDSHDDLRRNRRIREISSAPALNKHSAATALSGFNGGNYTFIQIKRTRRPRRSRGRALTAGGAGRQRAAAVPADLTCLQGPRP